LLITCETKLSGEPLNPASIYAWRTSLLALRSAPCPFARHCETSNRGAVVTELTAADIEDIYDIRATLEAMATRLSVPRMTEAICEELANIVEQMDGQLGHVATLVKLNHQFHSTLYTASGRRHLCDLNHTLRYRTQHYLHAYMDDLGSMALAQEEHRAILDACRRRDAEEAASLVGEHVTEVGQAIVEFVRRRYEGWKTQS